MTLSAVELARKINLLPRACIHVGKIAEQMKNQKTSPFSGFQPHFAMEGCPRVTFDHDGSLSSTIVNGAEIEARFKENDPTLQPLASRYNSGYSLIQLMFGSKYVPPTEGECHFMKEAGQIWGDIAHRGQQVFLVSVAVTTPAGGYSGGRFNPIAILDMDGTPLWLNPEGVNTWFSGLEYPAYQKIRSLVPAAPPKVDISWYQTSKAILEDDFKGKKLHDRILQARGKALFKEGLVSSMEEGVQRAQDEYEQAMGATPSAGAAPAPQSAKPSSSAPRRLNVVKSK